MSSSKISGGGEIGLGYTYSGASIVELIGGKLASAVRGQDAFNPQAALLSMQRAVRNLGREGLAATAISAVDAAIYDLKARLLGVPLFAMLGSYRDCVPIYGSGGFTTYSDTELLKQLGGWVANERMRLVKMKVGSEPDADPARVKAAKQAIGDQATLFVDANGAYRRPAGLATSRNVFAEQQVGWFEEPVSADDLAGLRATRRAGSGRHGDRGRRVCLYRRLCAQHAAGAGGRCAAGGCDPLRRHDRLSADRSTLRGIPHRPVRTLRAGPAPPRRLCVARVCGIWNGFTIMSGSNTCCSTARLCLPRASIRPDPSRPGNGLTFKHQDAARYAVSGST